MRGLDGKCFLNYNPRQGIRRHAGREAGRQTGYDNDKKMGKNISVVTGVWSGKALDVIEIALLFLPNTRQLLTIPTYSAINIENIHTTSFIFFLKPSRD